MTHPVYTVRFIFQEYGKFVTMELSSKVVFDDLKMSFSKILGVSFFAKQINIYIKNASDIPIDSSKTLGEIWKNPTPVVEFDVKVQEMGA